MSGLKEVIPKMAGSVCTPCGPYMKRCQAVVWILVGVAILIFLYWAYLIYQRGFDNAVYGDFLNQQIIEIPQIHNAANGWLVSHFLLYMALGIAFPGCWLLIAILSSIWEFAETLLYYISKRPYQTLRIGDDTTTSQSFWYGSTRDIMANLSGLFLGVGIRSVYDSIIKMMKS